MASARLMPVREPLKCVVVRHGSPRVRPLFCRHSSPIDQTIQSGGTRLGTSAIHSAKRHSMMFLERRADGGLVFGPGLLGSAAQGGFFVTLQEVGSDVVATGG